jgi:hypothetical protein
LTGKVVATSILNSSSLALTGGIGIMRLCLGELGDNVSISIVSSGVNASCFATTFSDRTHAMAAGIVNFGIQGSLFIFLLYALLAAETDPLSYTIKVLVRWNLVCRQLAQSGKGQHLAKRTSGFPG